MDRKLASFEEGTFKISSSEKKLIITLGLIYGIDKLKDNIVEARISILKRFSEVKNTLRPAEYIVSKNIIFGDALTLENYESGNEIIFP